MLPSSKLYPASITVYKASSYSSLLSMIVFGSCLSYDKEDMIVIIDDKKLKINILKYIEVKEKYK